MFFRVVFAQQDAQFSQYMFNGLYVNPAYAGYKEQLNLHTFYRNQWTGFPGAPKTMSLSVDAPMMQYNMGLGLQVNNDKVGIENSLAVFGIYSYRLKINDEARLSFGLGAGFINNSLDGTNSIVDDSGDELQPGVKSSAFTPDLKFGVYYNDERFYAGVSATNLLSPYMVYSVEENQIIPKRSPHIYLTSGGLVDITDNVKLKPSFLLKQELKGLSTLDLNMFVLLHDKFWVGTSYRAGLNLFKTEGKNTTFGSNSVVFLSEFYLGEQIRLGYAYDFSLNALQGLNSGSHEISLGYTMDVSNILGNTYHSRQPKGNSIKVSRERTEKASKEPKPKEAEKTIEKPKEIPKQVQPAPVKDHSEAEAKAKANKAVEIEKLAERTQRQLEKAEAKKQREREKEAARKLEREKREEEAALKAKAKAEEEVAKAREEKTKEAQQEPKSDYEKKQEKARVEAEKKAKKLRRKNGAMVSPRYF